MPSLYFKICEFDLLVLESQKSLHKVFTNKLRKKFSESF